MTWPFGMNKMTFEWAFGTKKNVLVRLKVIYFGWWRDVVRICTETGLLSKESADLIPTGDRSFNIVAGFERLTSDWLP